jgi:predicted adenine nucleotide alpha hydrolase (AANH) superfamily ATPase
MEFEPEGGKRCIACYNYRLEKTAQYATTHGFNYFSTTITTGPSKDAKKINQIGSELAVKYKITFLELDLKKQGGFLKSIVMSKKLGLYRQNYCGCIFSMNAPRSEKRTRKLEKQAMME